MHRINAERIRNVVREDMSRFEQGEDPRVILARVNERIVAYQADGLDVPAELLRLNQALAAECASQSQGR